MIIYPAIDIIDGQCVRLVKGDYDTAHQVFESPLAAAKHFESEGATHLHVVDLDGAKAGHPVNKEVIKEIIKATKLKIDLGGGIRSLDHIKEWLDVGVTQVVLGSIAVKNPKIVKDAVELYGDKIIVGIDAKDGFVAVDGWTKKSTIDFTVLASMMFSFGVKTITYTDINKDGTLSGVNIEHLKNLRKILPGLNLIASGGVADIKDIEALKKIKVYGAICGKAIYSNRLSLKEAITVAKREDKK